MPYSKRLQKLQKKLRGKKLDAILIAQPENRRFLSGYSAPDHGITESSGVLLIPATGDAYLLTDFRFLIQAENEITNYNIELYPRGLFALLKKLLPRLDIKKLAFESDYTLHSTAARLQTMAEDLTMSLYPLTEFVEAMRVVKDEDEIAKIQASVKLNEQVFQEVYATIGKGQSEIDIALAIGQAMRKNGAEGESFETIVATGHRSALPHAVPGNVVIEENKALMIDMGLILDGYCSDMTRTFVFGKADRRYLEIHRLVRKAQLAGITAVKAGVTGREVDKAARDVIVDAGMGQYFGHALGHGVGLAVHEEPRLSYKNRKKLKSGMIVTVEPGIYIPGWGGVRLENMVVVRDNGCDDLNSDTTWLDI
jgi:Xaa-Pro aminopeptidase